MGFHFIKIVLLTVIGMISLHTRVFGSYPASVKNKIFSSPIYNSPETAFKIYTEQFKKTQIHDFDLLRKIAEFILENGYKTGDSYTKKCCVLGAGISGSSLSLEILLQAIEDPDYILQLLALGALNNFAGKTVENILLKATASPFPIVRIEAIYKLALLKYPYVIDRLRPFLDKIPEEIKPMIGSILVHVENEESNAYIKQLLCDSNPLVRSRTVLLVAENQRDCFLNNIRNLSKGSHPYEQEAAAFALGKLQDFSFYNSLKRNLNKKNPYIKVASALALGLLGHENQILEILEKEILENKNLFAISVFRHFSQENSEKILLPIFKNTEDQEIKFNCAEVLITHKIHDESPYCYIRSILFAPEENKPFFTPVFSPGGVLFHHKIFWNFRSRKMLYERTAQWNEQVYLKLTENLISNSYSDLDKDFFLQLLKNQKEDLNPFVLNLLSKRSHANDLEVLEAATQLPGIPFTRAYANMVLYKITRDTKKAVPLYHWLREAVADVVILKEEEVLSEHRKKACLKFSITPEQKTQLLIEALETIVQSKKQEEIELFLDMLATNENKNFYLLIGLLIKITE